MAGYGRIVSPAAALGTGSHGELGMVPVDFGGAQERREGPECLGG
jgi:hypothetical protein